ncbi:HD domain-containing protein [Teredinibacter waterburyi]|uniref:HD domain-containing protein n=1 Tax=Teredinibacter waterburyi TaxID=1500538 RepID=UPI00165EE097|nr:HD domain-containing protein [Teredinibacter waterburyi]
MPNSRKEAFNLLEKLGAPEHLKTHVTLAGEAADLLIDALRELGVEIDFEFVRTGVAIHDIGKILHTSEMTGPGSEHEPEGEKILINNGASPKLARACMSHARRDKMDCSFEELMIALSDKLWKGTRVESIELDVVDRAANTLQKERLDIFPELDLKFEEIASGGHERLQRSVGS